MKRFLLASAAVIALAASGAYADDQAAGKSMDKGMMGHHHCQATAKLPKDKQEAFRKSMEEARDKNKDLHEQIHQKHEEMDALITAPKFDKDAFSAKQGEIDALYGKMHAAVAEARANALAKLSQKDRQALVAGEKECRSHWKHGKDMHKGKDEGKGAAGDDAAESGSANE